MFWRRNGKAGQPVIFDELKNPSAHRVRAFGIDLGTTNSTVAEAVWDPSSKTVEVTCLEVDQPTLQGRYTNTIVPSVVAVKNGDAMIGEGAKRLRTQLVDYGLVERRTVFADTKNEIGTSRTYPGAADDLSTPRHIATHILAFLGRAIDPPVEDEAVIVTVPASFQAAQRSDTRAAARDAGLPAAALLDEPIAGFLDFANSNGGLLAKLGTEAKNLLVFDFGGGTCDVAIFSLAKLNGRLSVSPIAVSRYHRLGGGDIDAAILHEVLIPQLCEQNGLKAADLGYAAKKNIIGPSFVGIAEALKVGLCDQVARLMSFGKYAEADKDKILKTQPGTHRVTVDGRVLTLTSPLLSAAQFEKLLQPFLDTELLFARSTEYRLTCSIFAPVEDALDRADLSHEDIDFALLIGGSTRIPYLEPKLRSYLPDAEVLRFDDREQHQTAIARGAALQALHLALTGQPYVTPVAPDTIALRTSHGSEELVPRDATLPYPPLGRGTVRIGAPQSSEDAPVDIRVEIVAGDAGEQRVLFSNIWSLQAPVSEGERLDVSYVLDVDQVLEFSLTRFESARSKPFEGVIENPLTNVVNPIAEEEAAERLETEIRAGNLEPDQRAAKLDELVEKYQALHFYEKAIDFTKVLLARASRSDRAFYLNRLGLLFQRLRNFEQSERMFREAAALGSWRGPLFNLAHQHREQGRLQDALSVIREALQSGVKPPYGILEAEILDAMSDRLGRDEALARDLPRFAPPKSLDDWELGWLIAGARLAEDTALLKLAETERKARRKKGTAAESDGMLPVSLKAGA